ncbi:MAG: hypothetical protein CXT75_09715, partial [Methanobacteriota archaeon]
MKSLSLTKKSSLVLLALLTLLLRYPITPSPTGTDSFYYISMAQAILSNGQIFWAENILSFYGLFPGTTPLGAPILATTICSVTGLSIYQYIFVHSITLSLISTFGFFMLTGEFTENYRSRWFAALCFSFAPRFLTFSMWRISLRFTFIALLPFFIWLLLRLSNSKYGRHPSRIIFLLVSLMIVLPSLHRMALLLPGMLLAFFISSILYYWQETAINRERAGSLFYLQYLDFSPYSPDDELIGAYLFSGYGVFSSIANLAIYYMLNVGPFLFISILGIVFWVQEGRIPQSYLFSMAFLTLSFFAISDLIYVPYLVTFGILLFIAPGMDFFIDNLEDHPRLIILSFSYYDLVYRIDAHEREQQYYTYYIRDSSISASQWMDSNVESTVLDCNDLKRERRLAAYSDMTSFQDVDQLSSGFININEMEIERISVKEMYWESSRSLWEWDNSMNLTYDARKNSTLSAVNLGMSEFSGKSSTLSLVLDSYYKNMPDFTYRLY